MGINIFKIKIKNLEFFKKKKNFLKKSVNKISKVLLILKKFNNLIFLNYSPELEKFLFWCQQLIAESLGKKIKVFYQLFQMFQKIIIVYYNFI